MKLDVVILAAGKGTRMNSNTPKVLHRIGGKSMLEHVIAAASDLDTSGQSQFHVVIGYGAEQIEEHFNGNSRESLNWVLQSEQLGTGHAVQQAMPSISAANDGLVLVLYGDVPLIKAETLAELVKEADQSSLVILTLLTAQPAGLGRILRNDQGNIEAIVEEKDASEAQKTIKEINSGIMVIPASKLQAWLGALGNNNKQGEYYLTDIVEMAAAENCTIKAKVIHDDLEVQGVNDKRQLALLERHYQMTKVNELLEQGATVRDPARVDIRGELTVGKDVEIDVGTIFEGAVALGDGVRVGANVVIKDASIGGNSEILPGTNIDGAEIGQNTVLGPYARIRPGTVLADNVKIGNFVETKKAVIGKGSKANHLAYIGDAQVGENCNIGAGTIFCNYDGANKHLTELGDNVFIGSNSVLVAPVKLEDNAFVAAGSSINCDVPSENLAVARSKQRNIPGWKRPGKK